MQIYQLDSIDTVRMNLLSIYHKQRRDLYFLINRLHLLPKKSDEHSFN